MQKTLILEVGASGGSLSLYQINDQFAFTTDESTLYDLLNEEDREGLTFKSTSELFDSFDAAMESMIKKYPVFRLVPLEIEASYKEKVRVYLQKFISEIRYEENFMDSFGKDRWDRFLKE